MAKEKSGERLQLVIMTLPHIDNYQKQGKIKEGDIRLLY